MLRTAGCVRIWIDRDRVISDGRAERRRLLAYLRAREVLVVWRLDVLADTPVELSEIAADLRRRRIDLRSEREQLDSSLPAGGQLLAAITAVGTLPGVGDRHAADRPVRRSGRPALLSDDAHAAIRSKHDAGTHTVDELAAAYGVSRPTIYRSLKRTSPA